MNPFKKKNYKELLSGPVKILFKCSFSSHEDPNVVQKTNTN